MKLTLIPLALIILSTHVCSDMLSNAESYLQGINVQWPQGFTVRWGTDTAQGSPGQMIPSNPGNPAEGGEIVINPEGIRVLAPNLSGDVTQYGGVLVVILYHELKHADGSYGNDVCSEIELQRHVAEKHEEFICFILSQISTANVEPLCTLYSDVQHAFNNGVSGEGGASTAWARNGCSGAYPGDIPDSICCH